MVSKTARGKVGSKGAAARGPGAFAERLEAEKAKRTVQLLFKAARLLNERAIARIRLRTDEPVRVTHTTVLPHVDLAGTRLTELARRLGVTKQAAGQLVDELEEMGFLERVADPDDARAKLVRYSKKGQAAMLEGLQVLGEIEAEMRDVVGEAKMRAMHEALAAVIASVEE
jgi:DNA-binding MarR family transcriptional regulator